MNILKNFLEMYVLKGGPQFLPYSMGILAVLWAVDLLLGGAILAPNQLIWSCLIRLLHLVILAVFLAWALRWRGSKERFVQTYMAILGVEIIMLGLMLIAEFFNGPDFVSIVLVFWNLAVVSNIVRQALEINPWLAVGLTFMFELLRDLMLYPVVNAFLN